MYIDVHCHIDAYSDKEIEEIVKKAHAKNVRIIVNNGGRKKANRKNIELSEKYPEIKAALGLYPLDAVKMSESMIDEEIDFIRKNKDRIIAIGEVGLDFKDFKEETDSGKERQKEIFLKFIRLAIELDKPIIVHSRKAEKEAIEMLEKSGAKKVIMHCFSGKYKYVKKIAENRWFLSMPASITYTESFQRTARKTEINRLLCETDSPFLHPEKGKKDNTPENVIESYKKIAEIKGIKLGEAEKAIENNFNALFGDFKLMRFNYTGVQT